MSSPRPIAIELIGCPFSTPVAYSFGILRNEKRIQRIAEFLNAFAVEHSHEEDSSTTLLDLRRGDIALAFNNGSWERCKLLRDMEGQSEAGHHPIPVFFIDKGLLSLDSVFKDNLRAIPKSLSQKFSPMPAPLIGQLTLADFELDTITFMAPDLLKSIAENIVTHSERSTMHLKSREEGSSFIYSGVSFTGELFVKFRSEFWNMYSFFSGLGDPEQEISVKDFLYELKNKNVRVKNFHPLMLKSKALPSGMESRVKSKKNKSMTIDDTEEPKATYLLSSNTTKSVCHIFYDKDPKGRKLKCPVLDIVEDYVGLDGDILKVINFYEEYGAQGICPISWPTIELNDSIICLGSQFNNRVLSYLIPVMNSIKVSRPESRSEKPCSLSCIMICSSFKTCIKLEDFCHTICSQIKVMGLFHSKELDQNTHAEVLNGCEILITTPHSLLRHIDNKVINMATVEVVVFEDGNLLPLFKVFSHEIARLMKSWTHCDLRFIVSAHIWSQELSTFSDAYLQIEGRLRPTVITDAPLEAAIYGGIHSSVNHFPNAESKINKLEELILSKKEGRDRVVVFTSGDDFDLVSKCLGGLGIQTIEVNNRRGNKSKDAILETWSQTPSLVVLLITDEMLMCLIEEIEDATSIVHFNLTAQSRKEFQFRHMVMRSHFKKYVSSRIQTSSHVFVDDMDDKALKYIYQYLLRVTNNRITDVISEDSSEYRALLSYFKNNSTRLCSNFKWKGSCQVKTVCPHRHRFSAHHDQTYSLPDDGIVYFTVGSLHEDSPLEMTVLLKKIKSGNKVFDFDKKHETLSKTLREVELKDRPLVTKPQLDDVYLWQHENKDLRRIKTFGGAKKTVVYFYNLDGSEAPLQFDVNKYVFYDCPNYLKDEEKYPRSRAQVILFGLKPIDNDPEWCRLVRDAILDCVNSTDGTSVQVSGRLFFRIGHTFWLPEVEVLNQSLVSGIHQSSVKLLKKDILLSNNELAEKDDDALEAFEQIALSVRGPEKEQHVQEQDPENGKPTVPNLRYAFFSESFEHVVICHMESPDILYIHRLKFLDLLTSLEKNIQSDIKQNKFLLLQESEFKVGDLVLAMYEDSYRRAQITELNEGVFTVFLVDYGIYVDVSEMVSSNHHVREYFNRLPCQAIQCHLNNIVPVEIEWSEECLNYLVYELMHYEKIVAEVREDPVDQFGYSVALFVSESGGTELTCLAHSLVDWGYAEFIDADQHCSLVINYLDEDAFNSEESTDDEQPYKPIVAVAPEPEDAVNYSISLAPNVSKKTPESIKWCETPSELILNVVLSLSTDEPINPESMYVRVDKVSVFIRYLEAQGLTHETPIPLILNDCVKPSKSRVTYGKGRSFKVTLEKRERKLWGSALISGLSFQWFTFNFDSATNKANSSPRVAKKKPHVAFPEAYFDVSDSDGCLSDSSSVESLD